MWPKTLYPVLFALGILVIAVFVYLLTISDEGGAGDPECMPVRADLAGSGDSGEARVRDPDDRDRSREVERLGIDTEPIDGEAAAGTLPESISVTVRFVDTNGDPLSDVHVDFSFKGQRRDFTTGADGRAEADFPAFSRENASPRRNDRSMDLVSWSICFGRTPINVNARREWYVSEHFSAKAYWGSIGFGDVILHAAGALSGRVVDRFGLPVGDVRVCCTGPSLDGIDVDAARRHGPPGKEVLSSTASSEDGSFRFCDLPPGSVRIWAGSHHYCYSPTEPVAIGAGKEVFGAEIGVDARPAEERIECLLLTPEGIPDNRARLTITGERPSIGATYTYDVDEEGWFRYLVDQDEPHSIEAWNRDGKYETVLVENVLPGTLDLVIQFTTSRKRLRLRVRDEKGELVDPFRVGVVCSDLDFASDIDVYMSQGFSLRQHQGFHVFLKEISGDDLDGDGIAALGVPLTEFSIRVDAKNCLRAECGPFDGELFPDPLDVVLRPVPGVRGRVLAGGEPVAGTRVSVHEAVKPGVSYMVNQFPCRSRRKEAAFAETDEEGRFSILFDDSGTFYARAVIDRFAPCELGPFEIDRKSGKHGLRFVLTEGGSIEGKVLCGPGTDRGKILLSASRGDGFPVLAETDRAGNYSFQNLTPGRWHVERCAGDWGAEPAISMRGSRKPFSIPWVCVVDEGRATRYVLDLTGKAEPRRE